MSTAACLAGVASGAGLASTAFWPKRRPSAYDFVLKFQSLSDFLASGQIDLEQSDGSTFPLGAVAANCRVVAVVGLFDKGKTFLINELFGLSLPSGKLCTTSGLSFFWAREQRILIVDSAGVQAPVSYRGRGQGVQPIVDAQTTESITFEVISQIAHQVIFVVSDLTWTEQKYIAMLCQKNKRHGARSKDLLVVHNMRTTASVREATALFSRQIEQIYDGVASHLGKLFFSAQRGEDGPVVQHIGLCQQGSSAGRRFNRENLGRVMAMLELRDTIGSDVTIGEQLAREFQRLLPSFATREALDGAAASSEPFAVDFARCESGPALVLRPARSPAMMRTVGVLSPLGEIISYDTSFQPACNFYERHGAAEVLRVIEVECPGVAAGHFTLTEMDTSIEVKIQKDRSIDESAALPIDPIRQTHGTWARVFPLDGGRLVDQVLCNGVLKITICRANVQRSLPVRHAVRAEPPEAAAEGPRMGAVSAGAAAGSPALEAGVCCLVKGAAPRAAGSSAAGVVMGPAVGRPSINVDVGSASGGSPKTEVSAEDIIRLWGETGRSVDAEQLEQLGYDVIHLEAASTDSSTP